MRVLLQHSERLTYYKTAQEWTSDPDAALSFSDPASALRYFRERGMEDMQIVLRFPAPRTMHFATRRAPELFLRQELGEIAEVRP